MIQLQSERVLLRRVEPDEIDLVIEAALPAFGESAATAAVKVRDRLAGSGEMTDRGVDLGIEADGRLIGDLQARSEGMPTGAFELGIGLFDATDRGKGYGRDAIRLLTGHLFASEGAHRVQLSTDVGNAAMRRVAERLGFVHEGTLRGFWPTPDGMHDYAMYGITLEDYEGSDGPWT